MIADAQRMVEGTAKRLGLDTDYVMPAYEDPAHWLQKEAALPVNVDPVDSKIDDPEERSRMARVFDEGSTSPTVLCCRSSAAGARRHGAG